MTDGLMAAAAMRGGGKVGRGGNCAGGQGYPPGINPLRAIPHYNSLFAPKIPYWMRGHVSI